MCHRGDENRDVPIDPHIAENYQHCRLRPPCENAADACGGASIFKPSEPSWSVQCADPKGVRLSCVANPYHDSLSLGRPTARVTNFGEGTTKDRL